MKEFLFKKHDWKSCLVISEGGIALQKKHTNCLTQCNLCFKLQLAAKGKDQSKEQNAFNMLC